MTPAPIQRCPLQTAPAIGGIPSAFTPFLTVSATPSYFPVATVPKQALIMSKGPVVISSTQQFDALLKSSRIVVADCE